MIFFLCNAPGCFVHLLILQVFFLQVFSTTCYLSNSFSFVDSVRDHSKVSVRLQVFKFTFFKYKSSTFSTFMMPVVTRSMSKYSASDKILSETPPRGHPVQINASVDTNHAGNRITRRSHTGIMIYLNCAPIIWYSKAQSTVESSMFGSEFVALCICVEKTEAL